MSRIGRDDWPLRMIDLPPLDKVRWMQIDPGRYFRQCREERLKEAKTQVDKEIRSRYDGGAR